MENNSIYFHYHLSYFKVYKSILVIQFARSQSRAVPKEVNANLYCRFVRGEIFLVMSDDFKLKDDGICNSCQRISSKNDDLTCFSCKHKYHVLCPNASADKKVASKSTVVSFLAPSTKRNFVFYCNICLTDIELDIVSDDTRKIGALQ